MVTHVVWNYIMKERVNVTFYAEKKEKDPNQ